MKDTELRTGQQEVTTWYQTQVTVATGVRWRDVPGQYRFKGFWPKLSPKTSREPIRGCSEVFQLQGRHIFELVCTTKGKVICTQSTSSGHPNDSFAADGGKGFIAL